MSVEVIIAFVLSVLYWSGVSYFLVYTLRQRLFITVGLYSVAHYIKYSKDFLFQLFINALSLTFLLCYISLMYLGYLSSFFDLSSYLPVEFNRMLLDIMVWTFYINSIILLIYKFNEIEQMFSRLLRKKLLFLILSTLFIYLFTLQISFFSGVIYSEIVEFSKSDFYEFVDSSQFLTMQSIALIGIVYLIAAPVIAAYLITIGLLLAVVKTIFNSLTQEIKIVDGLVHLVNKCIEEPYIFVYVISLIHVSVFGYHYLDELLQVYLSILQDFFINKYFVVNTDICSNLSSINFPIAFLKNGDILVYNEYSNQMFWKTNCSCRE